MFAVLQNTVAVSVLLFVVVCWGGDVKAGEANRQNRVIRNLFIDCEWLIKVKLGSYT